MLKGHFNNWDDNVDNLIENLNNETYGKIFK